jgi:cytoskeletal protein RodZ
MYFAVSAQSKEAVQNHGFSLSTLGVILMIAGAIGFVISALVFAASRRAPSMPSQTMNREVVDSNGSRTVVHEERQ